jgi:sporulation protein YlmC with PRC-barrel domain
MRRPALALHLATLCALLIAGLTGFADDQPRRPNHAGLHRYRFSQLKKMQIQNHDGQVLGRVQDLVIHSGSGHVRYSVLSFGGILGMGRSVKLARTPALSMETAKRGILALELTKGGWQALPQFRRNELPRLSTPEEKRGPANSRGAPASAPSPTGRDRSQPRLVSDLIGKSVLDSAQHKLGKVSDVLVDLSGQRPAVVILSAGGLPRRTALAIPVPALDGGPDGHLVFASPHPSVNEAPWFTWTAWEASGTNNNSFYRYEDARPDETPPKLPR